MVKHSLVMVPLALLLLGHTPISCFRSPRPAAMTGDGAVVGTPTSYDFSLHCNPNRGSNHFWVALSDSSRFELTRLTDAVCRDEASIDPGAPFANFDTYHGEGLGQLDGVEGARAIWTFTDAGEPGSDDEAEITLFGPDGDLLLEVGGRIARNHQARGTALLPIEPGVDGDNIINYVIVDAEARARDFEQTMLSADAFGTADQDPKPPIEETDPPKIHPDLVRRIEDGDPQERVEVLFNLNEVIDIPRFGDHPIWFGCDSPLTAVIKQEQTATVVDLLDANLQATEEFLARFQDGDHEIQVLEQFWLVNAFVADVRLGDILPLATDDAVQFIEEPVQLMDAPPSHDGNPNNDIIDARALINSDKWFNQVGANGGCIGLVDTGVDADHVVFGPPNPNIRFRRDCYYGGPDCADASLPGFRLVDDENHGTGSAGIISGNANLGGAYRGVTDVLIDSWKVWGTLANRSAVDQSAVIRAFQQGILNFDRVFAVELQMLGPPTAALAEAADNAFNSGAVVLAATGNCAVLHPESGESACDVPIGAHSPNTARSPSNAHKVLGVGAFNIESRITGDYQGYGPTDDGRIKPDIQAPTDIETASRCDLQSSDPRPCAFQPFTTTGLGRLGGTSASTPVAAGAAALMRNFLRSHNSFDPGHTYVRLILSGRYTYPYPDRTGAGPIELPECAQFHWGKVKVPRLGGGAAATVDIPIPVSPAVEDFVAALWWPESIAQPHSDIDLYLIDPNGIQRAAATDFLSVFERTGEQNPVGGAWTLRIQGIPGGAEQTVYWAADLIGCDAIAQKGDPYPPLSP